MDFKKVLDLSADITVAIGGFNKKTRQDNPTEVEGYYLGSRQVADKKKKSGFSYIHTLQTDKGNLGVWGKTDLDRKLMSVEPGTMVQIQFDKMVTTPNGEMYKFVVQFDESNKIDVADLAQQASANSAFSEQDADDEGGGNETYSNDEADAEDEAQNLALARAEQKAKVEAILKKGAKSTVKN